MSLGRWQNSQHPSASPRMEIIGTDDIEITMPWVGARDGASIENKASC